MARAGRRGVADAFATDVRAAPVALAAEAREAVAPLDAAVAVVAGFAALSLVRLLVPLVAVLLSLVVAGLFFVVVVRARLAAVDGPELAAVVFAAPDFGGVLVVFGAAPAAALAALTGLTDVVPFAAFVVFVALVDLVDTALADPDADRGDDAVFVPRGLSGADSLAETSGTARTADRRAAFFAVGAASG